MFRCLPQCKALNSVIALEKQERPVRFYLTLRSRGGVKVEAMSAVLYFALTRIFICCSDVRTAHGYAVCAFSLFCPSVTVVVTVGGVGSCRVYGFFPQWRTFAVKDKGNEAKQFLLCALR